MTSLTDTAVRNAKAAGRPFRLYDRRGLYLEVRPHGGKYWRLKYRFDGKEKLLALGTYPDVGLRKARERRDEARELLADGLDPGAERKRQKLERRARAASSFEAIAREWYAKRAPAWAASHSGRILRRLERDVFPHIGTRPIDEITPPEILAVLRRIEDRGAVDTAHRARSNCSQVFRYAVATGRAVSDPCRDLRDALASVQGGHFAAVTDPGELAGILRAIDAYQGTATVRAALSLLPMLFTRPGKLRAMRWAEVSVADRTWCFISKNGDEHLVPLPSQAVAIIEQQRPLSAHRSAYVFPGGRSPRRPLSDNAFVAALRRLEIPKTVMSAHGFRATARTLLHERLGYAPDVIEHQLAHRVPDRLGGAYNRTKFLGVRRAMMQAWADYLDALKAGEEPRMAAREA